LARTFSDAVASKWSNSCGGRSDRIATQDVRASSPRARLKVLKPLSEKPEPTFFAVLNTDLLVATLDENLGQVLRQCLATDLAIGIG
jgi:hypothetical protein